MRCCNSDGRERKHGEDFTEMHLERSEKRLVVRERRSCFERMEDECLMMRMVSGLARPLYVILQCDLSLPEDNSTSDSASYDDENRACTPDIIRPLDRFVNGNVDQKTKQTQ